MTDAKTKVSTPARPRLLWWRLAGTMMILAVFGWGFSASWFCEPAPSGRQQAVLFLLLLVILVQTFQAGWYRNDFPREIGYFEAIATLLKALAIIVIAVFILWAILFLVPDPILALIVIIVVVVATLLVIYSWDSVA